MKTQWTRTGLRGFGAGCLVAITLGGAQGTACAKPPGDVQERKLDRTLQTLLLDAGISGLDPGPVPDPALVRLGQLLFFDRELSGNRDTSCATCHHPFLGTGDGLSLPVGTAALNPGAIGFDRLKGWDREFVPRNAPEIFNRGSPAWRSQFWDSRVAAMPGGHIDSPAGDSLLPGLDSVLAVQAMFPVTSRDEMRGRSGDVDVFGATNEIAEIDDDDVRAIWSALTERLLGINEYRRLFRQAYPDKKLKDLTFAEAANAIAAFEIAAYTFLDSPWDRYLDGDSSAMTMAQKRGGVLFFGKARCVRCHNGPLLTDQRHYNLAVPQLGPGKAPLHPLDVGRFLISFDPDDMFRFRTPPLRNVAATEPWMHNGALNNLRDVVRHHAAPAASLLTYDPESQIDQIEVRELVTNDADTQGELISTIDWENLPKKLRPDEVEDLVEFLQALTAPNLQTRLNATIPEAVPSGLPIDGTLP